MHLNARKEKFPINGANQKTHIDSVSKVVVFFGKLWALGIIWCLVTVISISVRKKGL